MTKIVDLFGLDAGTGGSHDWSKIVQEQQCPFLGRRCYKTRKSEPSVAIGTCTVSYGAAGEAVIICPARLLERRQVFTDCIHLLTGHEPGNEMHIVSEVSIPGGSIDYFLVSTRERKVRDFVGIELQTLDTTGTVWPERQLFLRERGVPVAFAEGDRKRTYGMNWKMTAKTILVQLHHKIQTFEHMGKHLVLVVQDRLLNYMRREFSLAHLNQVRVSDPMQFHSYALRQAPRGHRIDLVERLSTDTAGIATCLGLQAQARIEKEQVFAALEGKISARTVFSLEGRRT